MDITRRSIGGSTSLVLDGLRLSAALAVLCLHAHDMWFPSSMHRPDQAGNASHAAVVVFFVLSGFVIAYTASMRNAGFGPYMRARLGRLCSMVVPALLLTAMVEVALRLQGDPGLMALYVRGPFGPRYLMTGAFLNEIWLFSAAPPANIALWSLSFEFWYYLIFGLWFFNGRGWKSALLAAGACVVAGPKIVLMMPIWLMGCAAYRLPRPVLSPARRWTAVVVLLASVLATIAIVPPRPFPIGQAPFFFANQFMTDWAVGLSVALALWLLPTWSAHRDGRVSRDVSPLLVRRVRRLADLTFPIYLMHYPLLVLWRVLFGTRFEDPVQYAQAVVGTLVVSSILGLLLEPQRRHWDRFFDRLSAGMSTQWRGVFAR
jgi:peptidoglycan/LPS O-acetylase OafA/YrhL